MEQEPPLKRRRTDEPVGEDWFDVENEGDFVLQSFGLGGLDAKDDGYRLSIERAYSNVRFQSTMTHIFEKYGRDFEGIGDEIDLMTGEIVVDNGHIHNMRNEIDVGDEFLSQQQQQQQQQHQITLQLQQSQQQQQQQQQQQKKKQEEEDAMLWKEFTYTDEDEEEDESTPQDNDDSPPAQDEDTDERAQDDDEHHEHNDCADPNSQIPLGSMALVPAAGDVGAAPGGYWAHPQALPQPYPPAIMPGPFWPGPFDVNPYAFGAPPMPLDPPPFTMIPSPFTAAAPAPWDLPLPFRGPQWTLPQAEVPRRNLTGHRYKFKAQKGTSSIWAVRSRYKEAEDEPLKSVFNMALGKHLSQSKPQATKSLPAPPARRRLTHHGDEEEDERPALSGTAKRKRGRPRKSFSEMTPILSEEEEDCDGRERRRSGSRNPGILQGTPAGTDSEDAHTAAQLAKKGRGRPRKRQPTTLDTPTKELNSEDEDHDDETQLDFTDNTCHADAHIQPDPAEADDSQSEHRTQSRRQSTQNSEHFEPPCETPQLEFLQEPACQIFRIEIPAMGSGSWDEYQTVEILDVLESEPDPANEIRESIAHDPETSPSTHVGPESVHLPDDQDKTQISSNEHTFSDPPVNYASERTAPTEANEPPKFELPKVDSACVLSDDEAPVILSRVKANVQVPKQQRKERKSNRSNRKDRDPVLRSRADPPEAQGQEAHEDAGQDPGDLESVAHTSHTLPASDDATPESRQARRGTGSDPSDSACGPGPGEAGPPPPRNSSDAVPPSSSPTRALTRFTAKISLNDVTPRLSRETRWLRRNAALIQTPNHEDPSSPGGEGAPPRRRRRSMSRKALSIAEEEEGGGQKRVENPNRAVETGHAVPSGPTTSAFFVPDPAYVSLFDALPPHEVEPAPPAEDEPVLPSQEEPATPGEEEPEEEPAPPGQDEPAPPGEDEPEIPGKEESSRPREDEPSPPRQHEPAPTSQDEPAPPRPRPPKTPRRRSILSLAPGADTDMDLDTDMDMDELGRSLAALPAALLTAGPTPRSTTARKRWKSSALTTEVYRTPVRAGPGGQAGEDSVVRTPGGTVRVCGVHGYRCGRDFCFTCL